MKKLALFAAILFKTFTSSAATASDAMTIQLIRSATVKVHYQHVTLLVDPILGDKGTEPPIFFSNDVPNPTIDLPFSREQVIKDVNAVLLTHYHPDHFDEAAEKFLPKDMLIFCQPGEDKKLQEKGFTNTRVIDSSLTWEGISITRFRASHHQGANGAPPFGESSSYYLKTKEASVFFTGDAILDERLKASLNATHPPVVIANTGQCHFTKENPVLAPGIPMTLTAEELKNITQLLPATKVVAVHMDGINHCSLTKSELRKYIAEEQLGSRVVVPGEGEILRYSQLVKK